MGLDILAASPGRVEQRSQALFSSSLSLLIHGMTPVISTHIGELPGGSNPAPGYIAGDGQTLSFGLEGNRRGFEQKERTWARKICVGKCSGTSQV